MLTNNIMFQNNVQQKVSVKRLGMKHYHIVKEFGILIGDALNAVREIAAITLLQ